MDHRGNEGEKQAQTELIETHLPLVRSLVRRLWKGREEEDLFQVGVIGLIKAAKNYDANRGTLFSTYAFPLILGEIKGYLREDSLVKISRDTRKKGALLQKLRADFVALKGREPTVEEAAAHLNMEREEIVMIHEASVPPLSLQAGGNRDEGGAGAIERVLAVDSHEDVVEKVVLRESLEELSGTEKKVIFLRYFREKTQVETGNALGLTQMQVSRLERKTLRKLRERME